MSIPFRTPLSWVYQRIPVRVRRLVKRVRSRATREKPEPIPEVTILPGVPEALGISPEMAGSSYEPDEVLPMLALENIALREKLFNSMDQADELREELAEFQELYPEVADAEAGLTDTEEPGSMVDEFLLATPEPTGTSHLVVASDYGAPGHEPADALVHRRVKAYQAAGVHVDVVTASEEARIDDSDGVRVLSGSSSDITELLNRRSYTSVSAHSLSQETWDAMEPCLPELDVHLFLHGRESSRWIRHALNHPTGNDLDRAIDSSIDLQRLWRTVVTHPHGPASYVFTSDWWRKAAMDDLQLVFPPHRMHVIHPAIDVDLFRYEPKHDHQRFHLLWAYDGAAGDPVHDLGIAVIQRLSRRRRWSEAYVTIVGDGDRFGELATYLGHLPNVSIQRRAVPQDEMARLHRTHGVVLIPARQATDGIAHFEAMASGVVPATNRVIAVGEFVDADCGIIAGRDDADALADGIAELWKDPPKFQELSRAAADRVRAQSGPEATTMRELELLNLVSPGEDR